MTELPPVHVPPRVRDLIWRLLDGWRPTMLRPRSLVSARWGATDVSARAGAIEIDLPALILELKEPAEELLDETDAYWNVDLRGTFEDGARLEAELSFPSGSGAKTWYWTISNADHPAPLWVGGIRGKLADLHHRWTGNLSSRRVRVSEESLSHQVDHSHLRLEGVHAYYLIHVGDNDWFLIVDTVDGKPPRREQLYGDFLALQFVLGRALRLEAFYGVDSAGATVAMVGGVYGRDQGEDARVSVPVPSSVFEKATWVAPFFAAISKTYATREGLRLYVPLSGYVEALGQANVEGQYLRLQIALEGLAFWFLKTKSEVKVNELADPKLWAQWVESHEAEIRGMARGNGGKQLVKKIRSAILPGSSGRVPTAFDSFGMTLLPEMNDELAKGRGSLVHTALMFHEPQPKLDNYLVPIALVRTMLVALLAKIVGYEGAIDGWEKPKRRDFEPAPASWWPVSEQVRTEAVGRYVADDGDVESYIRELQARAAAERAARATDGASLQVHDGGPGTDARPSTTKGDE